MDLNTIYDRASYDSEKYALRQKKFGTTDVLPMWIADMDLPSPDFVIQALQERLKHPILGYTHTSDAVYEAIIEWQSQYAYPIKKEHIAFTHNVANGLFLSIQAFTNTGDSVAVMPPIYTPFIDAPTNSGRRTIEVPLLLEDGRYRMDLQRFEKYITQKNIKLLLFCHPQNPVGRVWQREELQALADICLKHDVIIVSDEVHADLTFSPNTHVPMASLSDEVRYQTVTLRSPGKTFNLAGLQIGYAIIANPLLKQAFVDAANLVAIYDCNLFGQIALTNAYSEKGKEWRKALLTHFEENFDRLERFLKDEFPNVKMMRPEASYLVWLDFRGMFSSHENLRLWLQNDVRLGLNDGESFGGESGVGIGFMRMNLAVPKPMLEEALRRLKDGKTAL